MTDRPLVLSADQVRAYLAGKTQDRVVLDPQPSSVDENGRWYRMPGGGESLGSGYKLECVVGDRFWLREPFCKVGDHDDDIHACPDLARPAYYATDSICPDQMKWRSSATMPRHLSRLTLIVTDVRVQRLQEISADDAVAEGLWRGRARKHLFWRAAWEPRMFEGRPHTEVYAELWDARHPNPAHQWAANPWVEARTFRVVNRNIDEV